MIVILGTFGEAIHMALIAEVPQVQASLNKEGPQFHNCGPSTLKRYNFSQLYRLEVITYPDTCRSQAEVNIQVLLGVLVKHKRKRILVWSIADAVGIANHVCLQLYT